LVQAPLFGLVFETEREFKYFRDFQKEMTEGEISECGFMVKSLWGYLILQSCHNEPFVLDAVVAISALSISKRDMKEEESVEERAHAEFAYAKYGSAIQKMRNSLAVPGSNTRMMLIACILVCCFESLDGQYFNSLVHAQSGTKILRNWTKQHAGFDSEGIASPDSLVIEDVIVQAFFRLHQQVVTFFDSRQSTIDDVLKNEGATTIQRMPPAFYSLDEAQQV
jgi:hypothetical protein